MHDGRGHHCASRRPSFGPRVPQATAGEREGRRRGPQSRRATRKGGSCASCRGGTGGSVPLARHRTIPSAGHAPRILETTRRHRETFASDRVALVADPEDSGFQWNYLERLPSLTRSVRSALKTAWERHVDEQSPEIADDLLDAFELVPEFKAAVAEVRRLRGRIAGLRAEPPDRAEPFDRLAEDATGAADRWRSVADDEVPAAVREFLAHTADRGASLDSLNDEVRVWLDSRGLVGSLRLVWRGSA